MSFRTTFIHFITVLTIIWLGVIYTIWWSIEDSGRLNIFEHGSEPRKVHKLSKGEVYLSQAEKNEHKKKHIVARNLDPFDCVSVSVENAFTFPMCLFSDIEDFFISRYTRKSGKLYEEDNVMKILEFMTAHPGMGLIDIGANIGTYSLPVLHSHHPVVAVEPMPRAVRRLGRSAALGNVTSGLRMIHAGLSDKRGTLHLSFNHANQGGSELVTTEECVGWTEQYYCNTSSEGIAVIRLDDLLPKVEFATAAMKVDCEGHEWRIFKEPSLFFDKVSVPYIQMEWMWYLPGKKSIPSSSVLDLVTFFTSRHYKPYSPNGQLLSTPDWENWTKDIIWRKSSKPF